VIVRVDSGESLEVVRDLVGDGIEMPVEAVVGDVQLATLEPTDLGLCEVMVLDPIPLLEPVQPLLGLFGPESVRVLYGPAVHLLVLLHARDPSLLLEVGRDFEDLSF
jgi:hypothetical protein